MKILFTKKGTANGSWTMRGVQIAGMLVSRKIAEARAVMDADGEALEWADIIIVVKSFNDILARRLQRTGKPIIWDALDFWRQPQDHTRDLGKARSQFYEKLFPLNPDGVIFATYQMQTDLGGKLPVVATIPHHYRLNSPINPIRDRICTVGYEGSGRYLEGGWFTAISKACDRRNASFVVNPRTLSDVDIIFAVRGDPWRSYQTDNWKSNVKLANAQVTGTPFIGLREKGCMETASGAEIWLDGPEEVEDALRALEATETRRECGSRLRASAPQLGHILEGYRAICSQLAG